MTNRYLFQSKEWQSDLDLGVYDFNARQYDPIVPRTWQIDPQAESYYEWSPYSWSGNNPILNVDPTGTDWYRNDDTGSVIWVDSGDDSYKDDDGNVYNNIGTGYIQTLDDGTMIVYDQNTVAYVIDRDQTVGSLGDTKEQADVLRAMGPEMDIRTNTMTPTWEMLFFSSQTALMISGEAAFYRGPDVSPRTRMRLNARGVLTTRNVSQKARNVAKQVNENNGSAPRGYKGGRLFQNDGRGGGQVLPKTDSQGKPVTYREYDVNAYQQGVNRGKERVVMGTDGSRYYTDDHYKTFTKF